MIDAVVGGAILPIIAVRVGEVEATLHLYESDAVTTVVVGCLGVVGVLDVDDDLAVGSLYRDMYEGRLRGTDAMLESILDKRYEEHGRYLDLRIGYRRLELDIYSVRHTDTHQVDVVSQEFYLVL